MEDDSISKKRYLLIVLASLGCVIAAVCIYLSLLSATVSGNLMATVDEISNHDIETIEGSLNETYLRLSAVAKRMSAYGIQTLPRMRERLNMEAAASTTFSAVYLMDEDGNLYSSTYVVLKPDQHLYDELFADGREHFAMLYDDLYGELETDRTSLIYGIRLYGLKVDGIRFVAAIGRSDMNNISDQLMIESFSGSGYSSVVNHEGYYIVGSNVSSDLAGRTNFFNMLEAASIEDGVTVEDVRRGITDGERFVITCTTADKERLILSFAPIEGTQWSFIMAVPYSFFQEQFAPFVNMTIGMLVALVAVMAVMMIIIYRFMKRSAVSRAEAAARAEFLSNMSHEIRTPLNGIIGLNHLMERHLGDREAMTGYVHKLGKAAQYLLSLVNDILDVSKLQAGKVELDEAPFSLQSALENVCEMQREPIAARQVTFVTEGLPLKYPFLIGDEVRISQVFMNILSNAAKFTPAGGTITLSVEQRLMPGGTEVLNTVSIADTGCGMTPEFTEHIFDAFSQERNFNSASQKGTGLGMSISHLLITEMGGQLSVESELGKGSCFTADFPLPLDVRKEDAASGEQEAEDAAQDDALAHDYDFEVLPEVAAAAHERSVQRDASVPLNILIAEDNELNAEILSNILLEEGFGVHIATNGQEAVDMFAASDEGFFDVILMDAQMPVKDGYAAARDIRRTKRSDANSVYIIACTASSFAEDRRQALQSGMNDFLSKPLNFRTMLDKLRSI